MHSVHQRPGSPNEMGYEDIMGTFVSQDVSSPVGPGRPGYRRTDQEDQATGGQVQQVHLQSVRYRGLFTAGWFGVREKHCFWLKIYDRLRASEKTESCGVP